MSIAKVNTGSMSTDNPSSSEGSSNTGLIVGTFLFLGLLAFLGYQHYQSKKEKENAENRSQAD